MDGVITVCIGAGVMGTHACELLLQRFLLFQRRENPVYPTNETVAQVFARLSAYRDAMDGPQVGPVDTLHVPVAFSVLMTPVNDHDFAPEPLFNLHASPG